MSDSASTSALLCGVHGIFSPSQPCQASADHIAALLIMPPCCRETFPAAVVNVVQFSLTEPILDHMDLSTGRLLQCVLLALVGRA